MVSPAGAREYIQAIEGYVADHSTPLPPLLAELIAYTQEKMPERARMLSGPVQGTFLQTLAASLEARRILEIGTFTGFSALMMAAALPSDGELITCEVDRESAAVAQSFFDRSPHAGKIKIRLGPALETLKSLRGPFDLAFIDADKESYIPYYEASLPLLSPRGLIAADNALRAGRVLDPKEEGDRAIAAFNAACRATTAS